MGLDLYAGTFTRYYTRNWKTVVEAWAEANGVDFKRTESRGRGEALPGGGAGDRLCMARRDASGGDA